MSRRSLLRLLGSLLATVLLVVGLVGLTSSARPFRPKSCREHAT